MRKTLPGWQSQPIHINPLTYTPKTPTDEALKRGEQKKRIDEFAEARELAEELGIAKEEALEIVRG